MSRTIYEILYSIALFGGLSLLVAPFTRRIIASGSRHHRIALVFCGVAVTAWATLGLIDLSFHPRFTRRADYLLHHYKDMYSGAALGIMLLQFVSGEFVAAYRRDKQLRQRRSSAPER